MGDVKKSLHSYHAAASAFGGRLQRPIEQHLPVLAATSLPVVGGYTSARHENFRHHDTFSIQAAYTQVGGSFDRDTGSWKTVATSVVQGLNVNNVLFAERIVAQISVEHGTDSYHPKVSFDGTLFEGLRIGKGELKPALKLNLCTDAPQGKFPTRSCLKNEKFVASAHQQSKKFAEFWLKQKGPNGKLLRGMEHLDKDGENAKDDVEQRGSVLCSLVESIEGKCAGTKFGHAIHIPDFGRIFLGELTVEHGAFNLTMVRLDLGSPMTGQVMAAQAVAGGHGSPIGVGTG